MIRKLRSNKQVVVLGVLAMVFLFNVAAAFAQEPTVTPLDIPVNDIFSQTNVWMAVFAPVVAIGIGISVALAILAFLGNQIKKAFSGGGK